MQLIYQNGTVVSMGAVQFLPWPVCRCYLCATAQYASLRTPSIWTSAKYAASSDQAGKLFHREKRSSQGLHSVGACCQGRHGSLPRNSRLSPVHPRAR